VSSCGKVLAGRYRLVQQLGQGGMGSVWVAEHLTLRSPVAIKLIDPHIAEGPEALGRFMREAQASAALRSPHVVQVLDYGVDDGVPFIAMELLEGESLGTRLERLTRMPPEDTARILNQVARAITRAHDVGVIHRDLKPDNIFLVGNDDEEVAKVLDFGVAKDQWAFSLDGFSTTREGAILGTPYYMSPEQVEGSKYVDHRTDLWSLGVIAFECIVGCRPFDGESLGSLIMSICARTIVVPSKMGHVPPGFDAWFAKSTARNVEERFASAKEQAAALRQVCSELSTTDIATSPPIAPIAAASGPGMMTTGGISAMSLSNTPEEQELALDARPPLTTSVADSTSVQTSPVSPIAESPPEPAIAAIVDLVQSERVEPTIPKHQQPLAVSTEVDGTITPPFDDSSIATSVAKTPVKFIAAVAMILLIAMAGASAIYFKLHGRSPQAQASGIMSSPPIGVAVVAQPHVSAVAVSSPNAGPSMANERNRAPLTPEQLPLANAQPPVHPGSPGNPLSDLEPNTSAATSLFNRDAATQALSSGASQVTNCRQSEGPYGDGKVQVTFDPSGRVTTANITGGPFVGTSVGECVLRIFRRVKVPPFSGVPVTVSKDFSTAANTKIWKRDPGF